MRDVLDRLKAQLMLRLPPLDGYSNAGAKVELSELGAVASVVRDYAEAELIYKQANQSASE